MAAGRRNDKPDLSTGRIPNENYAREIMELHTVGVDAGYTQRDVTELARLLTGRKAHVNLIPWNDVEGLPYRRPADSDLHNFIGTLRRHGISVKVRKRKGSEIDAACGQLRRQVEAETRVVPR